jgi:pilus assembly protein CpaE
MTPQPAENHDPFDLDFDAETDFASSQDANQGPNPAIPPAEAMVAEGPVADGPVAESPTPGDTTPENLAPEALAPEDPVLESPGPESPTLESAPAPSAEAAPDPWAPVSETPAEPAPNPFDGLPSSPALAAHAFDETEEEEEPRATNSDPFAGLSPSRESSFHDDGGEPPDPFAGLGSPRAPVDDHSPAASAPNPIAEMLASAEAALGEHTVPRITIHAFWSRPEMSELVQRASTDRRMERAKTVSHEGGLSGAVAYYQNQPTPSLIIVESLDPAQKLLGLLAQLAEVCDPGTKVIVVGADNDISLYRELMRRGVSEYLVPPLSPLQLIAAITALYADPAQPFVGRQIAFCGAKGGAGASTLAHNIAYLISEKMGANTVLVDLDLAFGTAGLNFNQDPLHGIVDALTQPERLDPVLMERMMARCGDHLSLFAAPASIERDYDISAETFDEVAQKIRATTPYVVLDLPHAWTPWKRRMLTTSDDVVVVAEPDLASLRNAKSIVDLVRAARPNDAPPRVILNKVGVPMRPEIPVKDFGEAVGVPPSLVVGFDAKLFGQAANSGQMIAEVGPKSKSAEALDQLARMMISRRDAAAEVPAKQASLLDRLLRR